MTQTSKLHVLETVPQRDKNTVIEVLDIAKKIIEENSATSITITITNKGNNFSLYSGTFTEMVAGAQNLNHILMRDWNNE